MTRTDLDVDTDTWPAPGPGEWMRLADHFDRPWTAEYERIFRPAFLAGGEAYLHEYGMPVRMIDVRTVHGYAYVHPVPLAVPDSSRSAPATMLRILSRIVPALRRCERNAARTLRERPWRARAARWWERDRPVALAANDALSGIDPHRLDDHALAAHLEACETLAADGYRLHFELHGTDMLPIGLLLDSCRQWGVDITGTLDKVVECSATPEAAPLAPGALDQCIIGGYDIDRPRLCELPSEVRDAVLEPRAPGVTSTAAPEVLGVPAEHRDVFDVQFADACAVFPVRDDNGMILGAWRMGLLRRAYLAVGRRLAASKVLTDPALVFDAEVPELCTMLRQDAERAPSAASFEFRAETRARWASVDAPLRLGSSVDPPLHALPPSMRAIVGAQLMLRDLIERASRSELEGIGIGTTAAEGRARVASDADDAIMRLEPGDVLVVRATSPAFNAVLHLAAALVTEHGGALSHAAIAARELDVPAVVGVRDVTRKIADGARVRVDPHSGRVTVVDTNPS